MAIIKVYGTDSCTMTTRTLEHLRGRGIDYDYIDIEGDPQASAWVKEQNDGKEKKPTLAIDGMILSEPTNDELDEALAQAKA